MPEADSPPAPVRGTKAGRNEARKLRAALLNNLAAALLLAAFVQPLIAVAREARPLTPLELFASLAFAGVGVILFLAGQVVASRVEE